MCKRPKEGIGSLLLATVFFGWGCGNAITPGSEGTPLWTIRGRVVESSQPVAMQSLRVAMLWFQADGDGDNVIAEDLSMSTQFPAGFTLELYDLPPEPVMNNGEDLENPETGRVGFPGLRIALGSLIAYDDRNLDRSLDQLADDDPPVDWVLGLGDESVVYIEEVTATVADYPDLVAQGIEPGLNIMVDDVAHPPADVEIEILLTDGNGHYMQTWMCETARRWNPVGRDFGPISPEAFVGLLQIELVGGAYIFFDCADDGRSIDFRASIPLSDPLPCKRELQAGEGTTALAAGQVPPVDWPCVIP